jgi:hypothetical protein
MKSVVPLFTSLFLTGCMGSVHEPGKISTERSIDTSEAYVSAPVIQGNRILNAFGEAV